MTPRPPVSHTFPAPPKPSRTGEAGSGVQVRADVFPAVLVVAPPGSPEPASTARFPRPDDPHGRKMLDKVRVVVTQTDVFVFQDSSQGPTLIFAEPYTDYTPPVALHTRRMRDASRPAEAYLTTKAGKTLSFARMGGCGCGSRLKTFDPFKAILATTSKTETPA